LVGDVERNIAQAMGPVVWNNCASFLYLEFQENEPTSEYLDNTRIHPEDYVIARKISADALRIDEEDVMDETRTGGASAVVRRLIAEEQQGALKMLDLHNYANVLFQKFGQRKMYALETIRAEITKPYEELRKKFEPISSEAIFTMLTGETKDSLAEGMVVPVKIKKVFANRMDVKLDCGIDGVIASEQYPKGVGGDGEDPRRVYSPGQTVQAKLLFLNRKLFTAQLSLGEDALARSMVRKEERIPSEWDDEQEAQDKRLAQKEKDSKAGRTQRVIKHVNFHPFNSAQAEEYLGSKSPGDLIIRPSSRGLDHLAITWKVADNVYQHIDVLELDKENEFAIGRTLKIGGKFTYTDIDDLIVNHVNAMARKVNEMMNDERYQNGSKSDTGMKPKGCVAHLTLDRQVVADVHRSEPEAQHVRLLHQPQVSRLLPFVLQGRQRCVSRRLVCEGGPQGI
jgi:transcription elongation factor SPT6